MLKAFDIPRSSYQSWRDRQGRINIKREQLKSKVIELHQASRGAAGSRTLSAALKQSGEPVGRYQVRSLMKEIGLTSRQQKQHRYQAVNDESVIAPNQLNRRKTR